MKNLRINSRHIPGWLLMLSLLVGLPRIGAAISPDLSSWDQNLSWGETTNAISQDLNQEIVVVGNTVHMVWVANLKQDYWTTTSTNRLYYRRSLDGGKSWQPAVLLDQSDIMVVRDGDAQRTLAVDGQNVHIVSLRSTSGGDWYYMLDHFRSTDNGASFGARETVLAGEKAWHLGNPFVIARKGQVKIFYRYNPNWYNRGLISCLTSTDGGSNFSGGNLIDTANSMSVFDVRYEDGAYLVVWQTGNGIPGSYAWWYDLNVSVSTDDGANYTHTSKLNGNGSDGYGHVDTLTDYHEKPDCAKSGSNVYVVWTGGETNDIRSVFFARSTDSGLTFAPPVNLSRLQPGANRSPQYGHATISAKGSHVYVVCTLDNGQVMLWSSSDGGAKFIARELGEPTSTTGVGGWWPLVMIDPSSADGRKVHFFRQPDIYRYSSDGGETLSGQVHYSQYFSWAANNPKNPQWAIGGDGAVHLTCAGAIPQLSQNSWYYDQDIWYRQVQPQVPPLGTANRSLSLGGSREQTRYDNMQIPHAADLTFTDAFTIEAWVRFGDGATRDTTIIYQESEAHYLGNIVLQTHDWSNNRRPSAKLKTADKFYEIYGGEALNEGEWHHIAIAYDAGGSTNNFCLYVDGHLSATTTATGQVQFSKGVYWVGKSTHSYNVFIGNVDDIRMWNRALTELEIHNFNGSPRRGNEPGLVAYFPVDDSTKDASGRGHDGVLMYQETYDRGFYAAPLFTSPAMVGGLEKSALAWKVIADFATGMSATGLPLGLSLDGATGHVTGAPATPGVYDAVITATNFQSSTTQTLRFVINSAKDVVFREDFNNGYSADWNASRPASNYVGFLPGMMDLRANNGETYTSYNRPLNLLALSNVFAGDFMLTLGIARYEPKAVNWNRIVLTAINDSDNYVRYAYGYGNGRGLELLGEQAQVVAGIGVPMEFTNSPFLLRLVKQGGGAGDLYTALYSTNGVDFLAFGTNSIANGNGVPSLLGLWMGVDPYEDSRAWLDYFEVATVPSAPMQLFADTFTTGSGAPTWRVNNQADLYAIGQSQGMLAVSKPQGGTGVGAEWAEFYSAASAEGDFDARVDYRDAVLARAGGGWGNQIQLNCWIEDEVFCVVRGDEGSLGGDNVHVWSNGNYGVNTVPNTTTSGTLRIIRSGGLIKAYHNGTFLWQRASKTGNATLAITLQNNGTADAIAVKFDNFYLSAQRVPLASPVFITAPMSGGLAGAPCVWQVAADYASSLAATDLPAGLTMNAGGLITGAPVRPGIYTATITAANAQVSTAQKLRFVIHDTAGVIFREDFNNGLSTGWTQVPVDTSYESLLPGVMKLRANYGDTWANYNRPLNLFAINMLSVDNFVLTLGVARFKPALRDYPGIFLVAWDDTDNNIRYSYASSYGGRSLGIAAERSQSMTSGGGAMDFDTTPFIMRLVKETNVYTAFWSTNGANFFPVEKGSLVYGDGTPTQVGFWMGLDPQQADTMLLDYFEVFALPAPNTFARWAYDNNLFGSEAAAGATPSADGIANIFKYAFGIASGASAEGKLPAHAVAGDSLVLTYRQIAGGSGAVAIDYTAGGVTYTVQATDSLANQWQSGAAVAELVPGSRVDNGDGTETVKVRVKLPTGNASKFIRLAVRN